MQKTNGFEVIDALAGANPGEDDGLVGLQLVRDEGEDGGADHLLTGVSKDAGGGGFQLVILPVRSLLMMASSEDSMIAANSLRRLEEFL